MKHIQIRNSDMAWHIAANIQFPPNFDESKQYPAIISVHPFGSCKEQTSGNIYGKALAEKGYLVLAYDASFQGESGGEPRWIEDPTQRVEDISRVIDYAVTLPYVNAERIGVLGVCGGGGYAINAALTEKRIKAVVSITGVNIGRLFREGFSNYDPIGALNAMASQRTKEARGGELQINELLPASLDAAKAHGLTERDVYEATDYYKTPRGQQPGGATKMLFSHAQKTLAWDAFAFTEVLLTQPVMVVVGEKVGAFGAYRDGLEVYGRAMVSQDRQLVSLPDFSHYELYDKPEAVQKALENKQTIKQTLFARQPAKIHKPYPTNSKIIMGDVLNHAALKQAMQGQDVVYANLTGEDLDIQANSVIAAMKACDVKRLIFVLSLGIYDEVPGKFGEWNNAVIGEPLKPFRRAADAIEASGLEYTILRPAWLTDEDIIDYELTSRNEPFKGTIVSRKSVAALITDIIDKPEKHIGENIGINQPVTDGDKPLFM